MAEEAETPAWKDVALWMMPELAERLQESDTPYLLWQELWIAFEEAYGEPRNQLLINRIYQYAAWCALQPPGKTAKDDLGTCVTVSFIEHIPTCPPARDDMPNWFSKEEFNRMEKTFRYLITEEEFQQMKAIFG